jgi:hypothetical protein
MTDYNRLSDAETASKAFWGQDKWRKLRDNQDSHEERIKNLLAQSHQTIIDDFLGQHGGGSNVTGVDENLYDVTGGGVNFRTLMASNGSHYLGAAGTNITGSKRLGVKQERLAFRLNQDFVIEFRARVRDVGATAPPNMMLGFSDNIVETDETDCIAFFKGSSAGKWRFRCAKGGVDSSSDNIGNRATWDWLTITIERSGGGSTFQVRAYVGGSKTSYGSEIANSPFTTNLPDTVPLLMASSILMANPGTVDYQLDRWSFRLADVPENS